MEVHEAIQKRYSVRSYLDRPVEEAKLLAVLEAARLAPSASNRQEWRFVVVRDPEVRSALCAAGSDQPFIAQAPVVIACCAETDGHAMRCGHKCFLIDVAIAVDHMTLRALELGLGSCWVGAFDAPAVRRILGIPDRVEVVELLALGYPADSWRAKRRLSLAAIVKYDTWG
ncbi:MAG: nitroreductase family protein [Planctomycetota bacterium]